MEEESWRGVSFEAKDLIRRLLSVHPFARPSAREVYVIHNPKTLTLISALLCHHGFLKIDYVSQVREEFLTGRP